MAQEVLLAESFFQAIEGSEELVVGALIGVLLSGKAASIHAIVDVVVNGFVDVVDVFA